MTPPASLAHLLRLSDDTGLLEHANGALPRREHGYCVDDVARGLVVLARHPDPGPELVALAGRYLTFVAHAQDPGGAVRNRLAYGRTWEDPPGLGDWWGRAVWGLGAAVAGSGPSWQRAEALERFGQSARRRSPWPRATAFAVIGAAEVVRVLPDHAVARDLLTDARATLLRPRRDPAWPWPEPRLTYANAVVAEALIALGAADDDPAAVADGLELLAWLVGLQTARGVLSVTPAVGWGPGDPSPAFDQQPIEVAALADASVRALAVTGDRRWRRAVEACAAWWWGANDADTVMFDPATGGGYDGLTPTGPNRNQGAESTLAWLMTDQHARSLPAPAAAAVVS